MAQGQTAYNTDPSRMLAGQSRPSAIKDDESSYNSEASAAMRFGIFVKRGTQIAGPPTNSSPALLLTAVTEKPFGPTVYHRTYDRLLELDSTSGGVLTKVDLGIRLFGRIAVRVEGTIVPGDRPHIRAVSGAGGTIMGVARATAVAGETIDITNQGVFVSPDDGGTTPERFAWLFVNMLADPQVQAQDILAGSLTVNKFSFFKSTEQTGTGSAQNIAHGLGVTPGLVLFYPSDLAPATTGAYTLIEGSHTSTNVIATVTTGKKFFAVAFV